jgi:hypothetical protein
MIEDSDAITFSHWGGPIATDYARFEAIARPADPALPYVVVVTAAREPHFALSARVHVTLGPEQVRSLRQWLERLD